MAELVTSADRVAFAAADEARARVLATFGLWLTTGECRTLARIYGRSTLSRTTLYAWAEQGRLPRTDAGRWHRDSLLACLQGTILPASALRIVEGGRA